MLEDLWRAKYEIEQFLSHGERWKCASAGVFTGSLKDARLAVTLEFGKLILNIWGDAFAECWRIDDYHMTANRLQLELSRRYGRQQMRLDVVPGVEEDSSPSEVAERRRRFHEVMSRILALRFPGFRVERVVTQRDEARQLSGIYTRALLRRGGEWMVAIGVNRQERPADINGLLTAAIIWTARAGTRLVPGPRRIVLLAPVGQTTDLARRLTGVKPPGDLVIELCEVDERNLESRSILPGDQGTLFDASRFRLPRIDQGLTPHPVRMRILEIHPDLAVCRRPSSRVESIRFRGLEVASLNGNTLRIGVGPRKQLIDVNDLTPLSLLLRDIGNIRRPASRQKWHQTYRQQAERWLEDMLRQDIRKLDPNLKPFPVYPQVPAHRHDDTGLVDLLAITQQGRLVVIELKVTEDIQLPMQGLDYWLRIEWHRRRGHLQRRRYFSGVDIADEPALLYLVSPALRFHRTFDLVAGWLDPGIPACKVGINENWRSGIKVLLKERLHG